MCMIWFYIGITIELCFFIYCAHVTLKWLSKDKKCNLVGAFIMYIFMLLITEQCSLHAVNHFLYWMFPLLSTLFVLFHQDQLQKNFVAITHILNDTHENEQAGTHIISTILQIGLYNSMRQKSTYFIIEGNQDLSLLLSSSIPLNIVLQKKLVEVLCDSSLYDERLGLWITYTGIIKGINTELVQNTNSQYFDILPKKTDCLILYCNKNSIWGLKHENNMYEELNTTQVQKIAIQKIDLLFQKKRILHVQHTKKHPTNQLYS